MNGGAYTPGELFFQAGWCLSHPTLVEIPTKSQGFSSCCFRWGDPIRTWVPRPAQISVWSVLWPQLSDEPKWVLHVQFLFVFPASFGIQPLYTTEMKCVYQAHCLHCSMEGYTPAQTLGYKGNMGVQATHSSSSLSPRVGDTFPVVLKI